MGSGKSGLYSGTRGSQAFPGSSNYMDSNDKFSKYIQNRKDKDIGGKLDIIAHGTSYTISVQHNGKSLEINHRVLTQLIRNNPQFHGQPIRLLSCNTGKVDDGFAQNLANKLKTTVIAPTDYLWVRSNGSHYVTGGKLINGQFVEDSSAKGRMKTFKPKKVKK